MTATDVGVGTGPSEAGEVSGTAGRLLDAADVLASDGEDTR